MEFESYDALSTYAADLCAAQVRLHPHSVLGLATGSTPIGVYQRLIQKYREGRLDFSGITSFNLDEYCGIDPSHPQSYHRVMQDNLFAHINMDSARIHIPNGKADQLEEECAAYEAAIDEAGGIDLQILGIGRNGHIGFNEPADHFPVSTHVVTLHSSTIEANARFFDSRKEVPTKAVTMGLGSILRARKILLLAFGQSKQHIVRQACCGPVIPQIPASVLQLHGDVTVLWGK